MEHKSNKFTIDLEHDTHVHKTNLNWIQTIMFVILFVCIFISAVFFFNKISIEENMMDIKNIYSQYTSNSNNDQYIKSVKILSIEQDAESQRYYFTYRSDADWAQRIYYGSSRCMFTDTTIKQYRVGDYVDVVLNFPTTFSATQAIPVNSIKTSYTEDSNFIIAKAKYDKISTNLTITITCASVIFIAFVIYSILLHKKKKISNTKQVNLSVGSDSKTQVTNIKICDYCGSKNSNTIDHCSSCGAKLNNQKSNLS